MRLDDTKICVYQMIFDKEYSDDTPILQYFVMCGLGLCIKLNSCRAHMFHAWSFIQSKEVYVHSDWE